MSGKVTFVCETCGKEVERWASLVNRAPHHYCSHRCFGASLRSDRAAEDSMSGKIAVTCETCGKEWERPASWVNRTTHHYCSNKCFGASLRSDRVTVRCARCEKPFQVTEHQSQKQRRHYCSLECFKQRGKSHGLVSTYYGGCRCNACREANRKRAANAKRQSAPNHTPRHGTVSEYINFRCRCDACREAGRVHNKQYYDKAKVRRLAREKSA